jgi:hypothetical protein
MRVNIAGAFSKWQSLLPYIVKNKNVFRGFDVTVYDGIDNCAWNGGRINRDITCSDMVMDFYYRNNISIALTFTNPVVNISDRVGNELLEKFHKADNVIISINTKLREYIKKNFPLYKHTHSITGFGKISVPMCDDDVVKYQKLEQHYDYIVPRCEHVFDDRFGELNVTKYEVMLNDTCVYNCPYYGEHFKKIAEQNRKFDKPWLQGGQDKMKNIEECWLSNQSSYKQPSFFNPEEYDNKDREKHGDSYGMDLNMGQIKRLLHQGVDNFKITGREICPSSYLPEMDKYISMLNTIVINK